MKMWILYNNIIPFKGFRAITFYPVIFARKEYARSITDIVINHENIHGCQQLETLFIAVPLTILLFILGCGWWSLMALPLYFWIYLIEWIIRIPISGTSSKAYRDISSEQEAYANEKDLEYTSKRKHFAWITYMFN